MVPDVLLHHETNNIHLSKNQAMKTTKIISVLIFALILATANTVFCDIPEKPANREDKIIGVTFLVQVHLASDLALCGTYLVQLTDESGALVAPPQKFVPGVNSYLFIKDLRSLPFNDLIWKSRISAMLILVSSIDSIAKVELVTPPNTKIVTFVKGKTYFFNLYPNRSVKTTWQDELKVKE
jgi:hypothetical protein